MSRQVIEFREMQPASTRVDRLIVSLHVLDRQSKRHRSLLRTLQGWIQSRRSQPKPLIAQLDIVFHGHACKASTSEMTSFE